MTWGNNLRNKILTYGNRNTTFLHNTIKLRYVSNKITRHRHENIFLDEDVELDNHVIKF